VKEFNFFLERGEVKKQSPDISLAKSTFGSGVDRLKTTKSILRIVKPKYILENAYESAREAADALLYQEGFKSFSHEASIVYLIKKGFSESELNEFDSFRKIRNKIKYYGGNCSPVEAQHALALAEKIINKIQRLIK